LNQSVTSLLDCCHLSMRSGRVKYSLTCALLYCSLAYISGVELAPLAEDIKKFISLMKEFGQEMLSTSLSGLQQLVRQLMGNHRKGTTTTITTPHEETKLIDLEAFPNHKKMEDQFGQRMIVNFQRELGFFLNDRVLTTELTEALGVEALVSYRFHFLYVRESLMTGLCLLDMLRSNKNNNNKSNSNSKNNGKKIGSTSTSGGGSSSSSAKTERKVRQCIKRFKKWRRSGGASSCHHLLLLLEAEQRSCRKRVEVYDAAKMYESAISVSIRSGCLNDEALCNELAAEFFRKHDDYFSFKRHMEQAFDLYVAWGAIAKAQQLESQHDFLAARADYQVGSASGSRSASSARSKPRFTPTSTKNMRKLSFEGRMTA